MSVPATTLYSPPPGVIPPSDLDLNPMSIGGGLSCLFSSPSSRSSTVNEHSSLRRDDLSCSSSYSSSSPPFKCRDHSPVSVFHGPFSNGPGSSPPSIGVPCVEWKAGRNRLFSAFVGSALGFCLDCEMQNGMVEEEELTFSFEENLANASPLICEPYALCLLAGAQSRHMIFYEDIVVKAFYEAEKAHRGQVRASGDPYLQHCVETAVLLAQIGANSLVVAASLLHDAIDDSFMSYDYIFRIFGAGVADLIEGVSKLSQLSKLARDNNTASKTIEADRLHTMFLAMADARAVLIKLADRLHNMATLDALPLIKQQRFAKETLEIFAPLANRLGIYTWKEQLENLCFKHLHPQDHKELSTKIDKYFDEQLIASTIGELQEALKGGGVSYHILCGRQKSLYSIHRKMLKYDPAVNLRVSKIHVLIQKVLYFRKNLSMDEIHDIHGLRLVVENEEDCFTALEVVHTLWHKVTGRFKDYITHPKFNGYKSLHTVVMSSKLIPLEIQIRTKEMHQQAEFGFAAYWRYKEGDCKYSSFVLQMVEWARWVVIWQLETMCKDRASFLGGNPAMIKPPRPFPSHSDRCSFTYSQQCDSDGPIYIIMLENEKMSVRELPANSRVIEVLEQAGRGGSRWTPCFFPFKEELRPKLNHRQVRDPFEKLKMGDVVELTPAIPDAFLVEYREELQRMYRSGLTMPSRLRRR